VVVLRLLVAKIFDTLQVFYIFLKELFIFVLFSKRMKKNEIFYFCLGMLIFFFKIAS